jgi:hypothetical protein
MKYKSAAFWDPGLSVIVDAIQSGLANHFASVDVSLAACPDLRKIGVSASGMCGSTKLIEFGGEPYAHNPKYRGTHFDIKEVLVACAMPAASVFGAGMAHAGANNGHCGEMISNSLAGKKNLSRVARVGGERQCVVEPYNSLLCGPIANLFVNDGQPGDVIRIEVKIRIAEQISLSQAIRDSLRPITGDNGHIGMGGIFSIQNGKVRSHVMPDYDCIDFDYYDADKEVVTRDFLQFYEHMGPDLLCFCTLWTGDPTGGNLNLRTSGEHTHFYNTDDNAQQAGHYHGDVTPDIIHYVGYFNVAKEIVRFGDIYEQLGIKP